VPSNPRFHPLRGPIALPARPVLASTRRANLGGDGVSYSLMSLPEMRSTVRHILIFLATVAVAAAMSASVASAETTGTAEANPRLVRVGDPFEIVLTITTDESVRIQQPAFPTPQGLRLLSSESERAMQLSFGGAVSEATYAFTAEYAAEEPGEYRIGPFRVSYTTSEGQSSELTIDAVVVEAHEDAPRPASNIIFGPYPPWLVYLFIAMLVAILAGLIAAWIIIRKRPREAIVAPLPIAFRSPEQAALDEIRRLGTPSASDEDAVKAYYDSVDDILRKYVTKRYNVPTRDSTGWEIRKEFHRRERLDSRIKGVFELMNDCDWVKFAMTRPTDRDIRRLPDRAADILVGATGPVEGRKMQESAVQD
jgi:hypothetical protein